MARDTMQTFIHEVLTREDEAYGKALGFSLVHYNGSQQVEMRAIKVGSKAWDPAELAAIFDRLAETHSKGIVGRQQYELLGFFDKSPKEPGARYPFAKAGETEVGGIGTEGPTNAGIISQMMRHNEAVIRLGFEQSERAMSRQERTIDQVTTENRRLVQERFDTMELAAKLVEKAAQDEFATKMKILEFERSSKERELLIKHVPGIMNMLTGTEIFATSTVDSEIMNSVEEALKEEHIPFLKMLMPEQQFAVFMDRMKAIRMKKLEEKEKAKALGTGEA